MHSLERAQPNPAQTNNQQRQINGVESANQMKQDLFAEISEQARFELSHPLWQAEIQECFDQDLYYKLVHIS